MKKKVLDSQSLLDIALRELGSIEGVMELAGEHDLSLTEGLAVGEELELPPGTWDPKLAAYYVSHDIIPATAISIDSTSDAGGLLLEGIDFWGIEYDFIIS